MEGILYDFLLLFPFSIFVHALQQYSQPNSTECIQELLKKN
jgi:hypothetical protein